MFGYLVGLNIECATDKELLTGLLDNACRGLKIRLVVDFRVYDNTAAAIFVHNELRRLSSVQSIEEWLTNS